MRRWPLGLVYADYDPEVISGGFSQLHLPDFFLNLVPETEKEKEKLAELTYIPHLAAFHLKRISKPIHFPGNVRANPTTLPMTLPPLPQ